MPAQLTLRVLLRKDHELAIGLAAAGMPHTWRVVVIESMVKGWHGFEIRVDGPGFGASGSFADDDSSDELAAFLAETIKTLQ